MSRTFVLTVAICIWGFAAAVALADKGGPAESEKARLLKQIAELKAMVAKLSDVAARQQAAGDKSRFAAEAHKRQFAEQGFHKGPQPGHLPLMERLENIRAAVKHLNAAGLHDVAAAVARQGEQLEAAIKSHKHPLKGDNPFHVKGGAPQPFKSDKSRFFKGDKPFKPLGDKSADGALKHQLHEMSTAIGRLAKQVEQLQKTVSELKQKAK